MIDWRESWRAQGGKARSGCRPWSSRSVAATWPVNVCDCAVEESLTGSGSPSLRCSSTQRTLSLSVPTESERRARSQTWRSRFASWNGSYTSRWVHKWWRSLNGLDASGQAPPTLTLPHCDVSREQEENPEIWFPSAGSTSDTGSPPGGTRIPRSPLWGPLLKSSKSLQRRSKTWPGTAAKDCRICSAPGAWPRSATGRPRSTWTTARSVPNYEQKTQTDNKVNSEGQHYTAETNNFKMFGHNDTKLCNSEFTCRKRKLVHEA